MCAILAFDRLAKIINPQSNREMHTSLYGYLRNVTPAEMTDAKPVNTTHSLKAIVFNMTAEC